MDNGDGGNTIVPVALPLDRLDNLGILPFHQNVLLHAVSLQLYAFSGGVLTHKGLMQPLWLSLMLEGNGLRRMTPETAHHATRLLNLLDLGSASVLCAHFVLDPWKAYRLGIFPQVQKLLDRSMAGNRTEELRLRVRLATASSSDETSLEMNRFSEGLPRVSLLSSVIAYAAKQGRLPSAQMVGELEDWLKRTKTVEVESDMAALCAQVINALNLVHLGQGQLDRVADQMTYLLERVTPNIECKRRRAHIEGNAYFQHSILARKRGDRDAELQALLRAMELDQNFGTLYYRTAQILHDQNDERAAGFYEMAMALSPFDLATANDYGCWLMDSGNQEKFESWSSLCKILYPEQFESDQGAST